MAIKVPEPSVPELVEGVEGPVNKDSISIKPITNALIDEAEEAIPEECGKVLRLLTFRFSWLMNGKNA